MDVHSDIHGHHHRCPQPMVIWAGKHMLGHPGGRPPLLRLRDCNVQEPAVVDDEFRATRSLLIHWHWFSNFAAQRTLGTADTELSSKEKRCVQSLLCAHVHKIVAAYMHGATKNFMTCCAFQQAQSSQSLTATASPR